MCGNNLATFPTKCSANDAKLGNVFRTFVLQYQFRLTSKWVSDVFLLQRCSLGYRPLCGAIRKRQLGKVCVVCDYNIKWLPTALIRIHAVKGNSQSVNEIYDYKVGHRKTQNCHTEICTVSLLNEAKDKKAKFILYIQTLLMSVAKVFFMSQFYFAVSQIQFIVVYILKALLKHIEYRFTDHMKFISKAYCHIK